MWVSYRRLTPTRIDNALGEASFGDLQDCAQDGSDNHIPCSGEPVDADGQHLRRQAVSYVQAIVGC